MDSTSSQLDFVDVLDHNYCNKSVATQITDDAVLAPVAHTGRNPPPPGNEQVPRPVVIVQCSEPLTMYT